MVHVMVHGGMVLEQHGALPGAWRPGAGPKGDRWFRLVAKFTLPGTIHPKGEALVDEQARASAAVQPHYTEAKVPLDLRINDQWAPGV